LRKAKTKGKAKAGKIVLAIVILIALVPWVFLLLRNISGQEASEPEPVIVEEGHPEETPPQAETPAPTPPPTPAPTPSPPPRPTPEPEPEPLPEDRIIQLNTEKPELSGELDRISSRYNCASVSMVVFDADNGEYYAYQYGFADAAAGRRVDTDTKLRVASLSKLTTVICAMVLVDRGLLDLDTDISNYLNYQVRNPRFANTPITARMLMQHKSSLHDSSDFLASRDRNTSRPARALLDSGTSYRRREPGAQFEYSNLGYSVLAAVCENIYGKSFDIMAREVLFEPLGIDAAYVPKRLNDTSNMAGIYNENHRLTRSVQDQLSIVDSSELGHDIHLAQGNLTISAIDYAKILAMLGNKGALNDVRVLSEESSDAINNTNEQGAAYEQGLATRLSDVGFMPGGRAFWHTGSSFGTFAQYIYSADGTNRGIVVVTKGAKTNRSSNGMINVCTELSETAWNLLNSDNN